eukprot:7618035-Pyramimonas_sp.AAC.2
MSEWATQKGVAAGGERGWTAAAVLLDLLKAYEQIRHHWLVAAAIETGYPLWQFKLSLQLHCSPRILTLGSAASDVVDARQSVLPGDGFATTL